MSCRVWLLAALILGISAGALLAQGEDPLPALQRQLADQTQGGVFDLAHLLKPGGVRELQALAQDFEKERLRLWVVTVPQSVTPQVAERLYANLRMTEDDLLVVFNGKQVYGRTDALKGEPQAFADALRQSQPDFGRYWGKGLATFSKLLGTRMLERRGGAPPAADPAPSTAPGQSVPMTEQRREPAPLTWGVLALGVAVLLGVWIPFRRRQVQRQAQAQFQEHVATARRLFTEFGERVVYEHEKEEDARFVDFSRRLEACEKQKGYYNLGELARLIRDLERALAESSQSQ